MHGHRTHLIAGFVIAVLLASAATAAALASPSSDQAALRGGLDEIVSAGVPGALAFVRAGAQPTPVTSGAAELNGTSPIRPNQSFRIGSITKSFVAATTLQLAGEGRLRLDDTVERWLPGLLPRGNEITVRHLLQHTSGITDNQELLERLRQEPAHAFAPTQVVRAAARSPLSFRPGRGWAYANANYVLLGLIIQKATAKPLATVLRERVIVPLRLRHTILPRNGAAPRGVVHGYLPPDNTVVPTPDETYLDVTETNPSWTWAAGALISTAADVSRFYKALLTGRLIPRRLLKQMTGARPTAAGTGYGLGLLRLATPCGPALGHDGEIFGYTSLALSSLDGRRSIVLLANASHPKEPGAIMGAFLALAANALCGSRSVTTQTVGRG